MKSYFANKNILITGGYGFIGFNLVKKLLPHNPKQIIILDNLSNSDTSNFLNHNTNISHINSNIINIDQLSISSKIDIIFHLAAQTSVPSSVENPYSDFETNIIGSYKLLEFARINQVKEFIFASSGGTVYGEPKIFPTPEDYPLYPISNYGASKAAFEMYLNSYSHLYGIKMTSLRLGNIFGPGSNHGVIFDFFIKLQNNRLQLEILGDGKQEKSYLYIHDCVDAILIACAREHEDFQIYNLANPISTTVNKIATIVCNLLEVNPKINYTGGKRGWKGDVAKGLLDINKILQLGWSPKHSIEDGIAKYIEWLKLNY